MICVHGTDRRVERLEHATNYRPDIDGLRAIAIIAVVVFHAFPRLVPGGYLGVDVFFVISGFLISSIVARRLQAADFSFVEFYANRARRIFPALLVVLLATALVGRNAMLPNEFALLGRHIAAGAAFLENFLLRRESGYFDVSTTLKPLMHLWSLAIEEQFYLVFPFLAVLAHRFRLKLPIVACFIIVASFAYCALSDPTAAFFSPLCRAWELSIGVVCGTFRPRRDEASRTTDPSGRSSWLGSLGLISIAAALFGSLLIPALGHSLVGVALATTGTAACIWAGPRSWPNRFVLSQPAFVAVGLISYPLYLWHWPVFSFWTIVDGRSIDTTSRLLAIAISVGLAFATYQLVERPIRTSQSYKLFKAGTLAACMIAFVAAGLTAARWGRSYNAQIDKIIHAWEFSAQPEPAGARRDGQVLTFGDNPDNRVLLFGDSHAGHYINSLAVAAKRAQAPSPQIVFYSVTKDFWISKDVLNTFIEDKTIHKVIISYFWAIRYASPKIDYEIRCCGSGLFNTVGTRLPALSTQAIDQIDQQLYDLLVTLRKAGKDVYVVLDNPFGNEIAPRSLVRRSILHGLQVDLTSALPRKTAIDRTEPFRSKIQSIASRAGVKTIDPIASLCGEAMCPSVTPSGVPIYMDYDHISFDTAINLVRYFDFIAGDEPGNK
jgi:peptidoglycan/LPS O-acetylase OafA/YrhL